MEPQTYALIGIAVTSVLFLLGGAFGLGKLFQRVDTLTTDMTRLSNDITRLTTDVRQLAAEVRRTNEFVIALANHRHDVDGNTVFTVPDGGS
ncbi:MAG: hypothetical protein OXE87_03980 [Chloroflexi bacterium]|nr:hypothetical protein [Chloroflexota bacterium]